VFVSLFCSTPSAAVLAPVLDRSESFLGNTNPISTYCNIFSHRHAFTAHNTHTISVALLRVYAARSSVTTESHGYNRSSLSAWNGFPATTALFSTCQSEPISLSKRYQQRTSNHHDVFPIITTTADISKLSHPTHLHSRADPGGGRLRH